MIEAQRAAFGRLLQRLAEADYDFVAPTLATYGLVSRRKPFATPGDLRSIFGWGRRFLQTDLPNGWIGDLREAQALVEDGEWLRAGVRVSTLGGRLHLHSARSDEPRAVFFGPDSYRFVRFLEHVLSDGRPIRRAIDIGTGAGAGALALAALRPVAEVIATDLNPRALAYARLNAAAAEADIQFVEGAILGDVSGPFDLIIANPPYIAGKDGRLYRDGGDRYGAACALHWVETAASRLAVGGRLILYTGSAVVEGSHVVETGLRQGLARGLEAGALTLDYQELDPDIFGSLLRRADYADVERMACVGAVITRRDHPHDFW